MSRLSINRRTVLATLAGVPGLRLLLPAHSAMAQSVSSGRDVIRELGVRPCINAAGTYTALTGSLMLPQVVEAIQVASRQYVRLNELQDAVGKRIAELLKCEAAMVSAGALRPFRWLQPRVSLGAIPTASGGFPIRLA